MALGTGLDDGSGSGIASGGTATAALVAQIDSVATGTNTGLAVTNTTAAAAGAQQYSPLVRLQGNGWKTDTTAASQAVEFAEQVRPVEGAAAPTGAVHWLSQINGGGYTSRMNLSSAGILTVAAGIVSTAGNLTVASDVDTTVTLGHALIDSRTTDVAHFSHFDMSSTVQYGLKQTAAGATTVNAATGQTVVAAVNNTAVLTCSGSAITGAQPLTINSDTDLTTILGRVRLDSRATDTAYFSHFDNTASDQYALLQTSLGETHVNAKSGQELICSVGDTAKMRLTATAIGCVAVINPTVSGAQTLGTSALRWGDFYTVGGHFENLPALKTGSGAIATTERNTIWNGSSLTATFPSNPANGCKFTILNVHATALTVAAGSGDTLDASAPSSLAVTVSKTYIFLSSSRVWYGVN